jgi:hypothetical protein
VTQLVIALLLLAAEPDLCSLERSDGSPLCVACRGQQCPPGDESEELLVCCEDESGGACWSVTLPSECESDLLGSCDYGITWTDGTVTCLEHQGPVT